MSGGRRDERASVGRVLLTLGGWVLGILALCGVLFALASELAPATSASPASTSVAAPAADTGTSDAATGAAWSLVATTTEGTSAPPPSIVATPSDTPSDSVDATPPVALPLAGMVVAIDPGHQLHGDSTLEPIGPGSTKMKPKVTTGATGVVTHRTESSINLAVALKLRDELTRRGARVVMIRTRQRVNVANSKRAAIANDAHADLFVRIHCDSNVSHSLHGLSTLVPATNRWTTPIVAESARAGRAVHRAVVARTGATNLGVKARSDLSGFNWSRVPTVLVEMGFLSNRAEDRRLASSGYEQSLALGLADGVEAYLTSR